LPVYCGVSHVNANCTVDCGSNSTGINSTTGAITLPQDKGHPWATPGIIVVFVILGIITIFTLLLLLVSVFIGYSRIRYGSKAFLASKDYNEIEEGGINN